MKLRSQRASFDHHFHQSLLQLLGGGTRDQPCNSQLQLQARPGCAKTYVKLHALSLIADL